MHVDPIDQVQETETEPVSGLVSTAGDPFEGPGVMKELCRRTDWAATPLGPVPDWSPTLRAMVRAALDSPFPINLWCGPALVLIYNDAYAEVLGNKHPAALGRSGAEVWWEIWPQIAGMFDQIRAGGPPIYEEDAPFIVTRGEDTPSSAPNAWFTFALSGVRDEAGEVVCFLNVVSETTSRIQAERAMEAARAAAERAESQLRDIFAQAPAFMAVLRGPEHIFEYVNEAYYQLVGHRELIGRAVVDALPEVRGQGYLQLLDSVLRTGEAYIGREMEVSLRPTPDSEPVARFVDFVYYPIQEPDGTRSGIVAHGADVTDHVVARAEAQRARADAEQANRAKSQFLANMSHEIRTPINAVMGYADLLDVNVAGTLNPRQGEFVGRIRESSRHLLSLVDDILDLSKVEAGEMLVRMDDTSLHDVVDSAVQIVAAQAEARGLELRVDYDCGNDPHVVGDDGRIRQILLNLLSNAIKFTPGGGTVTIACESRTIADPDAALPDVGPWIVIAVEDTGPGIPPEHLPRIFEPFVQADAGHTRRASGTGLGLTISRRFARLMGGDLTVATRVGAGSRFLLWLSPAEQVRDAHAWTHETELPDQPHVLPALGRIGHILLASTEQIERALVERLRRDRLTPTARHSSLADIADHTAGVFAVLARTLIAIDEGAADDPLVRDGNAIQDIMSARHGRQRRRIGWSRAELEREYQVLHDVIDRFLRDAAAAEGIDGEMDDALAVTHRLIDRAAAASLRAHEATG